MATQVEIQGQAARALPTAIAADGTVDQPVRLNEYRELVMANQTPPTNHQLANEGSYYIVTTPTPGTGLASDIKTSYSATVPFAYIFNSGLSGGRSDLRVFLDYIKLIVTVAPASTTQSHWALVLDTAARAITTDNTTAMTPKSPNGIITATGAVSVFKSQSSGTASAIAGATNGRVVGRGTWGGLPIIGDELVIACGKHVDGYAGTSVTARKVSNAPPVIIGPGQSLTLFTWWVSNASTGLSYELEAGYWER